MSAPAQDLAALRRSLDALTSTAFVPTQIELDALHMTIERAYGVHGSAGRVRSFLFAWYNGSEFYGFDFSDLWSLDDAWLADVLTLIRMIARGPIGWYPNDYGYGKHMADLIDTFKPKRRPQPRKRK